MVSPNAFVTTVDVSDLDAALAKAQGARTVLCVPKMAIAGVGWLAYVKDPDGNILGMMQMDAGAG
jgi:predicted enzyme related to lactoylglutathione lyase